MTFGPYPASGRKKLAVSSCYQLLKLDALTVMQVVLVAQGWWSRIAQLARVSLHQRLTDVG